MALKLHPPPPPLTPGPRQLRRTEDGQRLHSFYMKTREEIGPWKRQRFLTFLKACDRRKK